MTRHYRLAVAAAFTVAMLATFVSLAVLSGLAAVPLPPQPTMAELGWVPCERTLAGVWICWL